MIKNKITLLSLLILFFVLIISFNLIYKIAGSKKPIATPLPIPLTSLTAPILVYHYVEYVADEKDTIRKSLNIPPYIFTKQIETLKNAGYAFVTASDLMDILDGKIKLPQKPIVLSFDDGYRDFYTDVFPILKKYNIKAVAYVVLGFLDKPNYLFTKQLKEIAKSRLVEIGAHTVHHLALRGLNPSLARSELIDGKRGLEKLINTPVVSFAYPDGSFDDQIIKMVQEAGYKSAAITRHGLEVNHDNKYSLYRIHPGDKTGSVLLDFVERK